MVKQKENQILIFYVGTRRIAAVFAQNQGGNYRILRSAEIPRAGGFRKGGVIDFEKAVFSVEALVKKLELDQDYLEYPTYLLLSHPSLKMTRFSSAVYYAGYPKTVTPSEVTRVVEQTRSVAPLPLDDWILQGVPESFWVNDLTGVQDPLGLEAQRLAVSLQIFTIHYPTFRNILKVFETLEFNLKETFPKTLVLPEGVLNGTEREGEALVMDFSDEATYLLLTRGGKLVQTKSLEMGSRFLTERIADTWHVGLADAERLKERFGSLEEDLEFAEELIPLVERDGIKNHQIRRSEFHQAFHRFSEELFSKIAAEVQSLLTQEKIALPQFVLTGGGVKLEGILDFLSRRFSAPIRLGTPRQMEASSEMLIDPSWSGVAGLLRCLASNQSMKSWTAARESLLERILFQAKSWIAAYF